MKIFRLAAAVLAVGLIAPAALAGTICPSFTGDPVTGTTGCNVLITISSTGVISITTPDATHPYDGNDDQLVGVINNDNVAISAITLNGGAADIFGFDGDGIDTKISGISNSSDGSGYGGPDSFFTGINSGKTIGTVNFVTALAAGSGQTYFSLEARPSAGSIVGTVAGQSPEPSSLILLGTGVLGIAGAFRRRFMK